MARTPPIRPGWTVFRKLCWPIFILALALVWLGFFFPDPLLYEGSGSKGLRWMLWGVRILVPLSGLGVLYLYYLARRQRLPATVLGLAAGGAALAALAAYPMLAEFYYGRGGTARLQGYHAYLQLKPPAYQERAAQPGAPPFRIFCLGGSTTAWADKAGHDWPSRVETALGADIPGKTVQVYNLAQEWYTSLHTLINYEINLRPHRPDLLVVMLAVNDLLQNADFSQFSLGPFREDYGHFPGPAARLIKRPSLLLNFWDKLTGAWYHRPRQVIDTAVFPGLPVFKRNLLTLNQLAAADGTGVVFLTEPYLFKQQMSPEELASSYLLSQAAVGGGRQWSPRTVLVGLRRYNQAVREAAAEGAAGLIDLEAAVPKSLEYFTDEVHYQDRAFPLVAERVAEGIRRTLSPR